MQNPRARKRGCIRKEIRVFYTYAGSYSKITVFGLIATYGRRMSIQCDKLDIHAFAKSLKTSVRRVKKIYFIVDSAHQHCAKMIRRLVDGVNGMTLKFLPAATTEISVIEMCRREIKCKMSDVPCINLDRLRKVIAQ